MYRWNPSDYDKNSTAQERAAVALISKLELKGDEQILDIGCGDGKVTLRLAALVPQGRVLGIDSSPEMVSFARRRIPSSPEANLSFEMGDALNLSFDREFDLVVSFACLQWVKDHLTVLKGIKRSLRPGGRMLIQCSGRGTESDIFSLTREIMGSDRWSKYFQGYSNPHGAYGPEEYHVWLAEAGLEEQKVDLTVKDMIFPGRAGLEGFIRTTWLSVTDYLPEEVRSRFINELAERYLERRPLEGDMAKVGMGVLTAEARRPD